MKILFIGDLHGSRENLELTRKSLEFCKALAIDKKVDRTVLLGDLHHVKANVRVEVQNLYLEAFKDWKNLDIIVGNHDYVNSKICEEHSLEIFKKFNNIRVIDKTIIDGDFTFSPYISNVDKLELPDTKYYVGHIGLTGFITNCGEFDRTLFKKYKQVILGHYHNAFVEDNIFYLGTTYTTTFDEAGHDKYVGIFDTKDESWDLVDIPLRSHKVFKLEVDDLTDIENLAKGIKKQVKEDDIVKIEISTNDIKINKSVFSDINVKSFIVKSNNKKKKDLKIMETLSNDQMMGLYIRSLRSEKESLLMQFNKEIMGSL